MMVRAGGATAAAVAASGGSAATVSQPSRGEMQASPSLKDLSFVLPIIKLIAGKAGPARKMQMEGCASALCADKRKNHRSG